ncbi:hypothetical protein EPUS_05860 [Endocarpon pusillum Z07020]|uniref:Uncharacterized protein n=1 Tax=Endocarpon pusillum (strain Z07020 / HMAS-L-300199) TaxID=1263415 RepID=U1GG10_ENDPU|nr:uncharacterized protein EPUS_05860 [Endocarpon pusillum Z07020]ERF76587.1 hypothetical protein EPUS_05860 [Endocarpon pusillum Z07020]
MVQSVNVSGYHLQFPKIVQCRWLLNRVLCASGEMVFTDLESGAGRRNGMVICKVMKLEICHVPSTFRSLDMVEPEPELEVA